MYLLTPRGDHTAFQHQVKLQRNGELLISQLQLVPPLHPAANRQYHTADFCDCVRFAERMVILEMQQMQWSTFFGLRVPTPCLSKMPEKGGSQTKRDLLSILMETVIPPYKHDHL